MKKRGMNGRPPKGEEALTEIYRVRLSKAEKAAIAQLERNFAEMVRNLLREKIAELPKKPPSDEGLAQKSAA